MYLKRSAETALREIISGTKVGIILGARQVGKTTLIEHVVQEPERSFSTATWKWTRRASEP